MEEKACVVFLSRCLATVVGYLLLNCKFGMSALSASGNKTELKTMYETFAYS
jgi:hypothetical protein